MDDNTRIIIEEVARIALENPETRSYVGHELGLTEQEMAKAYEAVSNL